MRICWFATLYKHAECICKMYSTNNQQKRFKFFDALFIHIMFTAMSRPAI
jgi:hypothetical protein